MAKRYRTLKDRLTGKFVVTERGCWEWTAGKTTSGYGTLGVEDRKTKLAHRVSYESNVGPIPDGLCVLHKCDVPSCINPDHLFLGTRVDNNQDMVGKGRQRGCPPGEKHHNCKLTDEKVLKIRLDKRSCKIVGPEYGVTDVLVSRIRRRKIWKHLK